MSDFKIKNLLKEQCFAGMYNMNSIQYDSCGYLTSNELVGYTRVLFMSYIKYNIYCDNDLVKKERFPLSKKKSNNKLKSTPFS